MDLSACELMGVGTPKNYTVTNPTVITHVCNVACVQKPAWCSYPRMLTKPFSF